MYRTTNSKSGNRTSMILLLGAMLVLTGVSYGSQGDLSQAVSPSEKLAPVKASAFPPVFQRLATPILHSDVLYNVEAPEAGIVELSWIADPSSDQAIIERCLDNNEYTWRPINEVNAMAANYRDLVPDFSASYIYRIRTTRGSECSDYSNEVVVKFHH